MPGPEIQVTIPEPFTPLFEPWRYKIFYGGRGGAKSQSFARALLTQAVTQRHLILCGREYQISIKDSVHRVLANQIYELGLSDYFDILEQTIRCPSTGSEFIFRGLHRNVSGIQSLEGATRVWIEEGQTISQDTLAILDPTIRVTGSEIWVSFNPLNDSDPIYVFATRRKPPNAFVRKVGWQDNPWFPIELETQRQWMLRNDPDSYDWVWEGLTRKISSAAVFKGRYSIECFETPELVDRFYYGADWGFANDPSVLVRGFIHDDCFYIDHEAYAVGVEIDDLPALFAGGHCYKLDCYYPGVPGATDWPIKADSARPETISYIARRGFAITAAEKWPGSVEDGIAHLKAFRKIIIHERCVHTAAEMRLYSYKTDPRTLDADGKPVILPKLEDRHNHCVDAMRYSLDGVIQSRGGLGVWARLLD